MCEKSKEEIDATKIAIERYRNIIGYLQYENSMYWTRRGLMLIAHSTLFGFLRGYCRKLAQSSHGSTSHWRPV